jgi:hypothetical protein
MVSYNHIYFLPITFSHKWVQERVKDLDQEQLPKTHTSMRHYSEERRSQLPLQWVQEQIPQSSQWMTLEISEEKLRKMGKMMQLSSLRTISTESRWPQQLNLKNKSSPRKDYSRSRKTLPLPSQRPVKPKCKA